MNFSRFFEFSDDMPTQAGASALVLGGPAHGSWHDIRPYCNTGRPRMQVPYHPVDVQPYLHTGAPFPDTMIRTFDYELLELKLATVKAVAQFWVPAELMSLYRSDLPAVYQYVMEGLIRVIFRLQGLEEKTCWSFKLRKFPDVMPDALRYELVATEMRFDGRVLLREINQWQATRLVSNFEIASRRSSLDLIRHTIMDLSLGFGKMLGQRFAEKLGAS
jgi:hypothetical protein